MDLAATLTLAALAVAIEACLDYPQGLFRAIGHPVTWTGRLIALADNPIDEADYFPDSKKWGVGSPERRVIRSEPVDYYDGEE